MRETSLPTVTPAENTAREILSIFRTYALLSGDAIAISKVHTVFLQNGNLDEDYQAGQQYARDQGWIELTTSIMRLTEVGFAEFKSWKISN